MPHGCQRFDSVLVVDDSRLQREHITALCHALGVAQVHVAEHGAAALALLDTLETPPGAMIIDLEMPVMDGVELIQHLRVRAPDIPFAVASTREAALLESVEVMARLQGMPIMRALQKPLSEAALREALSSEPDRGRGAAAQAEKPASPIDAAVLLQAVSTGRIVPWYQPKVDARTGVIRGVEVLARWIDPSLGNPTPDRFIPAAEAHGQIHALTWSIMEQAFAQAVRWNARGLVLSIAVNLSPQLLERPHLVEELSALALRHRLAPEQIVLELTENAVTCSPGSAIATLTRLRMKGFGLSIDDFGTGFSSIQRLVRIPCTELKIDRSLVSGAHRNQHQRAVLQSAIDMATRLSLACVAEGVEALEDWRLLQRCGCTVGQGWLFGKAMPAVELPAWLKQHGQRLAQLRAQDIEEDK